MCAAGFTGQDCTQGKITVEITVGFWLCTLVLRLEIECIIWQHVKF